MFYGCTILKNDLTSVLNYKYIELRKIFYVVVIYTAYRQPKQSF